MHTDLPPFAHSRQDDSDNPMLRLLYRYADLMRTLRPDATLTADDRITISVATRFIYTRAFVKTGRATETEVARAAAAVQWAMTYEPCGRVALRNRIYFDRPFAEEASL